MFDYVIVGAGSAGCVLANRLSADTRVTVLLLEAGPPDRSAFIRVPKGSVKLFGGGRFVWHYPIEPPAPGIVPGQAAWIRGRTLGGSSSINGMMYVRGQPADYDRWEELGNPGWGWREMGRCFREMEDHQLGADGVRGVGGPLAVSCRPRSYPLCDAVIAAGAELGLPVHEDLNRPDQLGIGYYPMTIQDGRRVSAARAFLDPIRHRPNLTILTDVTIDRILFAGGQATGVSGHLAGRDIRYDAAREVIVSAGAIESPKLLQLSGIGPAEHLRRFGIEPVVDSPGVGANLREHPVQAMQFRLTGAQGHNRDLRMPRLLATALRYYLRRDNVMASCGYEVGAFAMSRPELDRPDIQLHVSPFSLRRLDGHDYVPEAEPGLQCIGNPLRIESQGSVMIRSPDPIAPPVIRPNYLTAAEDRRVMTDMIGFMRRLFATAPIAKFIASETFPTAAVTREDEVVACFHRAGQSGFHAVGTCRMGDDPLAVVDADLRVHGVGGLRVADCSVMPEIVSGNTNGPAMALAWRAAERIRATA